MTAENHISESLTAELVRLRRTLRMAQSALAAEVGASQQAVSQWEAGMAPLERLREWADAVAFDLNALALRTDRPIERALLKLPPGTTLLEAAAWAAKNPEPPSPDDTGPGAPAAEPPPLELAALSGKIEQLSVDDRKYVEDLVNRLLDKE